MLDRDLIRRQRLALGLSRGELRRRLGLSQNAWRRLLNDPDYDILSLGLVRDLAEHLAVTPAALLDGQRHLRATAQEDDVKLEAALAEAQGFIARDVLAEALAWELARLFAAADRLGERLAGTGLALRRDARGYGLRPRADVLSEREETQIARRCGRAGDRRTAGPMTPATAAALRRLLAGDLYSGDLDERQAERQVLGRLLKLGYVEIAGDGLELSADVVDSLAPYATDSGLLAETGRSARRRPHMSSHRDPGGSAARRAWERRTQ